MKKKRRYSYSCTLITQGKFKMYSATIPSDVLAANSFVSTREEDRDEGFQRLLNKKRAEEIANYIDSGLGTVPSAIILSAQSGSDFVYDSKNKVIKFNASENSFLILDGQHRVYGYSLASSVLRIPVVIYTGLSRRDETRLFIDINTTQKQVPSELLLDIKKLAEYEKKDEQELREVFDWFHKAVDSSLKGLTSPSSKSSKKISRVTFNNSIKPLLKLFSKREKDEIISILDSYFSAVQAALGENDIASTFTTSVVFRAFCSIFKSVIKKHKIEFGVDYDVDNFYDIIEPPISTISAAKFRSPGLSYKKLADTIERKIDSDILV